jgi:hypothetical protein
MSEELLDLKGGTPIKQAWRDIASAKMGRVRRKAVRQPAKAKAPSLHVV